LYSLAKREARSIRWEGKKPEKEFLLRLEAGRHDELSISANPWGRERTQSCSAAMFAAQQDSSRGAGMLWTIFVVLMVLWLLGMVSSYTMGGFIHILLLLAVVALVFQLISGRRTI
jgi:Flp pilus assembly protein TadB